jgi:hypothetical protein
MPEPQETEMKSYDLPCLVIIVDRHVEDVSLLVANDRESLRAILSEARLANEAKILDLEAVVIDDRDHPPTRHY